MPMLALLTNRRPFTSPTSTIRTSPCATASTALSRSSGSPASRAEWLIVPAAPPPDIAHPHFAVRDRVHGLVEIERQPRVAGEVVERTGRHDAEGRAAAHGRPPPARHGPGPA